MIWHGRRIRIQEITKAIRLLENKRIDVRSLVSHRLASTEFKHGVELIRNKRENVKKVLILPNG